ncbi:MAG: hypothetical protein VR73_13085 [Gammaproteobacteria bacterium BRH_c0]|nr:MAG: hypothetical protein VR73_13085 [Gammaproteobacteria bacterium BRH_c0]
MGRLLICNGLRFGKRQWILESEHSAALETDYRFPQYSFIVCIHFAFSHGVKLVFGVVCQSLDSLFRPGGKSSQH